MADTCALCDPEQIPGPITNPHPECGLRMVIGGIGHLIAHEYWCNQRHDPDAGLTYRQSAMLVDTWVRVMGIEAAVQRT